MNRPLVTVIMSVYNDAKWLDQSIPSILSQTLIDFEFIIINDGSTDTTANVIAQYAQLDPRIVVCNLPKNSGLSHALNAGLALAKTDFIARHDADDIAMPERLQRLYDHISTHPECAIVGSNATAIDGSGQPLGTIHCPQTPEDIRRGLIWSTPFIHPSVMFRRQAVLDVGGYDEKIIRCEDYDLWFRLLAKYEGANLVEPLMMYRIYPDGYKKKKFKYRLVEAQIKWRGLQTIGVRWWDYVYVAKPVLIGMIPKNLLRWIHISRLH